MEQSKKKKGGVEEAGGVKRSRAEYSGGSSQKSGPIDAMEMELNARV